MPTYTITRTITYEETYTVADVDSEQEAVEVIESGELDPDVAVPVGDERYDVDSIEREEDEAAGGDEDAELTPEMRALLARAVDVIENEADLVRDDDSGDRSAEVKRLVRALPDGPTLHRLAETFTAEAGEVYDETDEDRAAFDDPVAHAVALLPEGYR